MSGEYDQTDSTEAAWAEFTGQKPDSDEDKDGSLSTEDPATRRLSAQA